METNADAKKAYDAWLASLPEDQRAFTQGVMAVVMLMVDDRYNDLAGEVQRIDRRQITNSARVAELQVRLDFYEKQQWDRATEAIEQFAKQQLPIAERDALIEVLYNLARDVEALKARRLGEQMTQEGGDHGDGL